MNRSAHPKLNFRMRCRYCGKIFLSNRSTATYCSDSHKSLADRYGDLSALKWKLRKMDKVKYRIILGEIWDSEPQKGADNWSIPYTSKELFDSFGYEWDLPVPNNVLFVSGFAIKQLDHLPRNAEEKYCIKPAELLSIKEILSFINGGYFLEGI